MNDPPKPQPKTWISRSEGETKHIYTVRLKQPLNFDKSTPRPTRGDQLPCAHMPIAPQRNKTKYDRCGPNIYKRITEEEKMPLSLKL